MQRRSKRTACRAKIASARHCLVASFSFSYEILRACVSGVSKYTAAAIRLLSVISLAASQRGACQPISRRRGPFSLLSLARCLANSTVSRSRTQPKTNFSARNRHTHTHTHLPRTHTVTRTHTHTHSPASVCVRATARARARHQYVQRRRWRPRLSRPKHTSVN